MANNSIGTTPIIRISQLPEETELTISGNPANTWFAIVNADQMKTKRTTLESLLKFLAVYFKPAESINYFTIIPEGGISANDTVYLGNTVVISDNITFTKTNAAFQVANSAYTNAISAFVRANNAYYLANNAFIKANASYIHANSAYNKANGYFTLNTEGGLRLNQTLKTADIFLGNNIQIDDNVTYQLALNANTRTYLPITINTSGGISGGSSVRLGESINLNAISIYNHSNSSYERANNSMINPAINYVTSNGVIAYSNNRYILLSNNISITLQNDPKINTYVYITNMTYNESNKIFPGNRKIHGLANGDDLVLDIPNISVALCYVDTTRGWVIV